MGCTSRNVTTTLVPTSAIVDDEKHALCFALNSALSV
jgi:hypothetical protein